MKSFGTGEVFELRSLWFGVIGFMRRTTTMPGFKEGPVLSIRLSAQARDALWSFDSKKYAKILPGTLLELSPAIRAKLKREGLTPELLPTRFVVIGRD